MDNKLKELYLFNRFGDKSLECRILSSEKTPSEIQPLKKTSIIATIIPFSLNEIRLTEEEKNNNMFIVDLVMDNSTKVWFQLFLDSPTPDLIRKLINRSIDPFLDLLKDYPCKTPFVTVAPVLVPLLPELEKESNLKIKDILKLPHLGIPQLSRLEYSPFHGVSLGFKNLDVLSLLYDSRIET